jgi:dolichol-phosphate mannosyltransferase
MFNLKTKKRKNSKLAWVWNWAKFNLVGVLGVFVQLFLLKLFVTIGISYVLSTLIAVEITIIHNFFWHENWTWQEDTSKANKFVDRLFRLAKFNSTTGGISLLGNLVLMKIFVGGFNLPILIANLLAIICCSTLNFLVSHKVVFRKQAAV